MLYYSIGLRKVHKNNDNYETLITTKEAVSNNKAVMKDMNKKHNKTNEMTIVGTGDDEKTFRNKSIIR